MRRTYKYSVWRTISNKKYPAGSADPDPPNRRIMVARTRAHALRPSIDMHMLDLHAAAVRDARTDEDVVDLLAVLVVDVRVALRGRDARQRVRVLHDAREGREERARLLVVVEVAREDDRRGRFEREDGSDEVLAAPHDRVSAGTSEAETEDAPL
jgi:hypothetical protein